MINTIIKYYLFEKAINICFDTIKRNFSQNNIDINNILKLQKIFPLIEVDYSGFIITGTAHIHLTNSNYHLIKFLNECTVISTNRADENVVDFLDSHMESVKVIKQHPLTCKVTFNSSLYIETNQIKRVER